MAKIFISYKRADKDIVFPIKDRIERNTGEKCWIDIDGIESDAQFKNVIIKAINECEVVLFMYSKEHTKIADAECDWTTRELYFASLKKKRIVFINIDGSPLTVIFSFDYGHKQHVDGQSDKELQKLEKDINKWLGAVKESMNVYTLDVSDAISSDEQLSDNISIEELNRKATCFFNGHNDDGIPDYVSAFKYSLKAAEKGSPIAALYLGRYYTEGLGGVEKDYEKGFKYSTTRYP